MAARIWARVVSSVFDQTVISSMVRKQPVHRPLGASIWQILMQGEGVIELDEHESVLLIANHFNRFECFVAADSGKYGEMLTLVAGS